jgi:hypothetical protein
VVPAMSARPRKRTQSQSTGICHSYRKLRRQYRLLLPVRVYVDLVAAAAALAAFNPSFEPRHFGLARIARHADQRLVAAGVV